MKQALIVIARYGIGLPLIVIGVVAGIVPWICFAVGASIFMHGEETPDTF